MTTIVKQFGYGSIAKNDNGEEFFFHMDGDHSPIIKTESDLKSAIREITEGTEWKFEKIGARYFFTHPNAGDITSTLEVDLVKKVCTFNFDGNKFKILYLAKKNIQSALLGQMENVLAP